MKDGFSGGARNAMEKSREDDGDEGVTMIAGRVDFSVTMGNDRSNEGISGKRGN